MPKNNKYSQIQPCKELQDFIDSFWEFNNSTNKTLKKPIVPDSFFKIVFFVKDKKVVSYFITGLFTEKKEVNIPPNVTVYGCRLKILAPEFLVKMEVASLLQGMKKLDTSFLNLIEFDLIDFESIVKQWENEFLKLVPTSVADKKLNLSRLLDAYKGDIRAKEVSEKVFWSNRQINRYLNNHIGISLKKYLNIQKVYSSFEAISKGEFFPDKNYFDQAHFIREVKKHTGETPQNLHNKQNDRFIQLKDIKS
mgnify:CR=1 FL=1